MMEFTKKEKHMILNNRDDFPVLSELIQCQNKYAFDEATQEGF